MATVHSAGDKMSSFKAIARIFCPFSEWITASSDRRDHRHPRDHGFPRRARTRCERGHVLQQIAGDRQSSGSSTYEEADPFWFGPAGRWEVSRGRGAALVAFLLAVSLASADTVDTGAELGAREIMEKNFFVSKLKSLRVESHMTLINAKGQKRERKSSNIVKLQSNGIDSKFLVKFSSPSDIRGTAFLQIEHSDGDDDLWIYLPALKKSRRLVANNKKDSFVGSDFSYGDILLPKVDLYRHILLRSETLNGHDCFVVESTPTNETVRANSGYGKKITWVRKDNFLETKVEYFDLSGRLLKTQVANNHQIVEPDTQRWLALYREMTNHQTGHKTVLRIDHLERDIAAPDELFSIRYLERE